MLEKDEESKYSDRSEHEQGTEGSNEVPRLTLDANGNIVFSQKFKSKKAKLRKSLNSNKSLSENISNKMSQMQKTPI